MMKLSDNKAREEKENQLWQNCPLSLTKAQRLKAHSETLIPLLGKNGAVERYMDNNAELTDNGRYTVYALDFRPTGTRPNDYEAHVYFAPRKFLVNTSLIPEIGDIVLCKDGDIYRFKCFDETNELEIFGVLNRVVWRLDQGEN